MRGVTAPEGGSSRSEPNGAAPFNDNTRCELAPSPRITSFLPPTFISTNRSLVTPRQKGPCEATSASGPPTESSRISTTSLKFMLSSFSNLCHLPASGPARQGEHLIEAFAEAVRERSGVGDGVWVEVDSDAACSVVGHHRNHGWDPRPGTHRVDARDPSTRQIERTTDRPEVG